MSETNEYGIEYLCPEVKSLNNLLVLRSESKDKYRLGLDKLFEIDKGQEYPLFKDIYHHDYTQVSRLVKSLKENKPDSLVIYQGYDELFIKEYAKYNNYSAKINRLRKIIDDNKARIIKPIDTDENSTLEFRCKSVEVTNIKSESDMNYAKSKLNELKSEISSEVDICNTEIEKLNKQLDYLEKLNIILDTKLEYLKRVGSLIKEANLLESKLKEVDTL